MAVSVRVEQQHLLLWCVFCELWKASSKRVRFSVEVWRDHGTIVKGENMCVCCFLVIARTSSNSSITIAIAQYLPAPPCLLLLPLLQLQPLLRPQPQH